MFDGNITAGGSAAKSAKPAPDAMDIEEEEKAGEGHVKICSECLMLEIKTCFDPILQAAAPTAFPKMKEKL